MQNFYLDLVKITLEIIRNNFVEKEKNFFGIKTKCFKLLKMAFFPKVLTHAFGQKNSFFFLYLFLVKIRLETRFNSILDRKETFF